MTAPGPKAPRRIGRLLWFAAFYALSLVVFTGLVYLIRFIARGG